MMIEIVRQSDNLNRQVWEFWPQASHHKTNIVLDTYKVQTRPTPRHKWKTTAEYTRQGRRSYSILKHDQLEIDDVPVFPSDVVEEVMAKFMATVTIRRESR